MARVSVGLPVYNGEKYLEGAIKAILAQTFTDFVVHISDNGSTDGTQAICERYAAMDSRIRYHRYDLNRGASWNFNNVFYLSDTEFFKWACHDDLIEPQMLEVCVAAHDREPHLMLVYPRTRVIGEQGETIGLWSDNLDMHSNRPSERLRQMMRNKCRLEAQHGLWRREALINSRLMGAFPLSDQVLMAEMAMKGQFREVPDYAFLKRFHPNISTEAYSQYTLVQYLDPTKKRTALPRLTRLIEFLKAVGRVKMSPYERLLCYAEFGGSVFMPANWFRMAQDIITTGRGTLMAKLKR